MDIEKDSNREAFEAWAKNKGKYVKRSTNGDSYVSMTLNSEWEAWQAAKAQAIPEGFVLVSQKELLELVIAINAVDLATHTEGKPNEVREMWQQVALKLGALCTTGASQ